MGHAFGWIQDPGSIDNLFRVVELFDHSTPTHQDLVTNIIPTKILTSDGQRRLIRELSSRARNGQPVIKYRSLVGTAFRPRASARCNGIIQALIPGQRRGFIGDWPADNFLRWAHAMSFISYDKNLDSFFISRRGSNLARHHDNRLAQINILRQSLLEYPPTIRILELLYTQFKNSPHEPTLTKFELGRELGFRGEDGFTTYPQHIVVHAIATNQMPKNKILSNWEGSSDKYARMICGWLCDPDINWVKERPKIITANVAGNTYQTQIPQSYQITQNGIVAYRRARQRSRHRAIGKRIFFEMLATKELDREYLRTRRALMLKLLTRNRRSINDIQSYLTSENLNVQQTVIEDDLKNLSRIGLEIRKDQQGRYNIRDRILSLQIPRFPTPQLLPSEITQIKMRLSNILVHINHTFLDLIDLSFNSKQNKLFEMKIIDLLNMIPNLTAIHLGGGNKPDGIAYYPSLQPQKGVIMDAKAYSRGFSIPIGERDKMKRYIDEYNSKNVSLNPTQWWVRFQKPTYPTDPILFTFISGRFYGNFVAQIRYIRNSTTNNGSAISSEKLLEKVENVLNPQNPYDVNAFWADLSSNSEIP